MKANRFLQDNKGFAQLVPMVLVIVIAFAVLFIGAYVNGEIFQSLEDSYPTNNATGAGDWRSVIQNQSVNTMVNSSNNWDSTLDIVQVVIIITVLAAAIGAIFLFTRFR